MLTKRLTFLIVLLTAYKHPLGPDRCKLLQLDVTSPFPTIRQAAADAVKIWGRIDVLVHNAGAGMLGIVEEVG